MYYKPDIYGEAGTHAEPLQYIIFAILFSYSPSNININSRNSDPGSHPYVAGSSPSPLRFVPFIFIARRLPPFLPSSTRVDCAYPRYEAFSAVILFVFANKLKISPRWYSNSRTNATAVAAFHGNHYNRPPGYMYIYRLLQQYKRTGYTLVYFSCPRIL